MNGCTAGHDHAFGDELVGLARRVPELEVPTWYAPSDDERSGGHQYTGFVDPDVLDDALSSARPLLCLCGPPPMMKAVTAAPTALGGAAFEILTEASQSTVRVPDRLAPRTVCLGRSGGAFTWSPASCTLLDAAERAARRVPDLVTNSRQAVSSRVRLGQAEGLWLESEGGHGHLLGAREQGWNRPPADPATGPRASVWLAAAFLPSRTECGRCGCAATASSANGGA
ncbi:hypothetical protein ACFY3O_27735 [Streptomyces sp. NPDC001046]|uniref:hypothetical protein n=1 Tax=Streptomyces sp. NPDC001046 TaxID=3364543 RepID=UPI0036750F6B